MGKLKEILIKRINRMGIVKIIKIKVNQNTKSKSKKIKIKIRKKKKINLMIMKMIKRIIEIVKHHKVK
jgi:hypothetical protein